MHDYLLAPEKLEISQIMLSKYRRNIADEYGIKSANVNKLVPNLGSKSKYVLHYTNVQLYYILGMKFVKVMKFKI